jgi:hypothetical protein
VLSIGCGAGGQRPVEIGIDLGRTEYLVFFSPKELCLSRTSDLMGESKSYREGER